MPGGCLRIGQLASHTGTMGILPQAPGTWGWPESWLQFDGISSAVGRPHGESGAQARLQPQDFSSLGFCTVICEVRDWDVMTCFKGPLF